MKKQIPIISFEHTSFQYEGQIQENLRDVNLTIKSGEFLVITGQSGCGKTTLTRCINNLIPRFLKVYYPVKLLCQGDPLRNQTLVRLERRLPQSFKTHAVSFLLLTAPARLRSPVKIMESLMKKSSNVLTEPFNHWIWKI